jgi:hypothetical protein
LKQNKGHTPDLPRNTIAGEIDSITRTREEMSREYGNISREQPARYLKDLLGALGIKSAQPTKVRMYVAGKMVQEFNLESILNNIIHVNYEWD